MRLIRGAATSVAVVALTGSMAAGCGGAKPAAAPMIPAAGTAVPEAGGAESITVHGSDQLMFAPMDIHAKVGTLTVTFVNDGTIAHTFRIKGLEPDTGNVNGHRTANIAVVLPRPGTYHIQCDYHPTMVGTLTVTA